MQLLFTFYFLLNGKPSSQTSSASNIHTLKHQADGVTPLFICVQKGNLSMVSMLLSAKADANIVRASDQTSPVHLASERGYAEIVKALVNATSMETLNRCSPRTHGT